MSQVETSELSKTVEYQGHDPLAFFGAELKERELRWTTYEKEAFAIFMVFEKLEYLFHRENPIHIFTDHRNLMFVFSPLSLEPSLGRAQVSKVQLWAMYLSRFDYAIEHIAGDRNILADILTRCLKGYKSQR